MVGITSACVDFAMDAKERMWKVLKRARGMFRIPIKKRIAPSPAMLDCLGQYARRFVQDG
jgi:hypothetical protein